MRVLFTNPVAGPGQVTRIELDEGGSAHLARLVARRNHAAARYLYLYDRADGLEQITYPGQHQHGATTDAVRFVLGELRGELLVRGLLDQLAALLPVTLTRDIPAHLDGPARMACATTPLLRDLTRRDPALRVPTSIPADLTVIFRRAHLRDAVSLLTGQRATRPAADHLAARLADTDPQRRGQLRLRELSMLPATHGLSPGHIENLLAELPTAGDGGAHLDPRVAWAAGSALARLGSPSRHLAAVQEALARADGHRALETIGLQWQARQLRTTGVRTFNHLLERTRTQLDQRWNQLHGTRIDAAGLVLHVVLPGQNHELAAAGRDMHNCLGQYVTSGPLALREGAIVLAIDGAGRRQHALQIDGNHRLVQWSGPRNRTPDAQQASAITAHLRAAGIHGAAEGCWDELAVPF